MIEIFEKDSYYDYSMFTGQCFMYPTYMRKNNKEYFMFNRREPDNEWKLCENESRKQQLISTDSKYFRFHGFYDDPEEMLKAIAERKHSFVDNTLNKIVQQDSGKNFWDFSENRNEVSAAFFYRIYDPEYADKIKAKVQHILRKEYEAI